MLHELPTEIALHAISYLPLRSLCSINLVSRDWNALIATNEPAVYRNAAILHRFIDQDRLRAGPIPVNWKTYCRRQLEIERGWRGKAPSAARELTATGPFVHRIKVDYELGFVITTCQIGGLIVCDIKTNRILWALLPTHTVSYAHCEYDRGYIVFNRYDNCMEVWRRTVDANGDQHSGASPPDKKMIDASRLAAANFRSGGSRRGHFKAWALLRMPENTRAFRFSFPTLLAAAGDNAYVWDVPRSQLVSVVRDLQRRYHDLTLDAINYVEVNDLYVFICGKGGMRIFAREGGTLLYQLSTRELTSATWDVRPTRGLLASVVQPQMLLHNCHSLSSFHGEFMACHISGSGNDLAVLTSNGRLVILPGFRRLFAESDAIHHRDIAIILNFQPFSNDEAVSYYLAAGGRNGKLAVAMRRGIYVISPDFDFNRLTTDSPPEPGVSVCRLSEFDDDQLLSFISCLQITHDAIYFTYMPSHSHTVFDSVNHDQVQNAGAHNLPNADSFPGVGDDMEDGFEDDWEDEDDDELMDDDAVEDDINPMHAILDNFFLPTNKNTVHSVRF